MAEKLKDLAEFDDPNLHLMYQKKHYTVKAASFSLGKYLHKVFQLGLKAAESQEKGIEPTEEDEANAALLDDDEEADFIERCLTPELIETLDKDGVPYKVISLMAMALMLDTTQSRETALAYWNAGGKAPAPAKGQKTATQTPAGAATTTKPQDYQNTTKTPAKGKATNGRTSSNTGKK